MTFGIAYDLRALEHDAQAWGCVSRRLSDSGDVTESLNPPSSVFRCVTSAETVATAYSQILNNMRTLLVEGSKQAALGEEALREIANAYRADEEAASAEYGKVWESLNS